MARHNIRQREEGQRGKKRAETTGKVRQQHGGMDRWMGKKGGRTWVEE